MGPRSEPHRSPLNPAVPGTAAQLRTIRALYIEQRLDLQELLSFSKFEKFSLGGVLYPNNE